VSSPPISDANARALPKRTLTPCRNPVPTIVKGAPPPVEPGAADRLVMEGGLVARTTAGGPVELPGLDGLAGLDDEHPLAAAAMSRAAARRGDGQDANMDVPPVSGCGIGSRKLERAPW
jgi:hypothetical protein